MLIKNLQYLAALAHERHFARAAAACNVAQPTLSAGIKQLEEELGLLLVRRGQRFEGLTEEGERILTWAARVLADHESLEQEAAELRGGLVGRLRIGAIPTALPIIPLITGPFLTAHPHVVVTVLSQSSREIQRGLDDFSLDAGLTYLENEPLTNVRTIPLYHERYYFFTPPGNPLASKPAVSWTEAATASLCLLTPDMQNRRILDAHFAEAGAKAKPVLETSSVMALWAQLQGGAWSSVLPESFLYVFGRPDRLAVVPMDPVGSHSIGLALPDREPLSPSARELALLAGTLDIAAVIGRVY